MKAASVVFLLLIAVITLTKGQLATFRIIFDQSEYSTSEGEGIRVRLSASTVPSNTPFSGSIEVDVIVEDLTPENLGNQQFPATFQSDYLVDTGDINSKIFTVNFTSLKAQSSDYVISIVKDETFERDEVFGLKINGWRLLGGAGSSVRIPPNTINQRAQVIIIDENFVEVSWNESLVIVTEGETDVVRLVAKSVGAYSREIFAGVECDPSTAATVIAATPDQDYLVTATRVNFSRTDQLNTFSDRPLSIQIFDDEITEPRESLVCLFLAPEVDAIRAVTPVRATIVIEDNDVLNVAWEREEYIFREDDGNVNVSLVTTAILERLVTLEGEPRAITRTEGLDRISNGIQSITVQSPFGPKDINLVEYKGVQYTLARVLPSFGDIRQTRNDFNFRANMQKSTTTLTIEDDSILEFDEIAFGIFDFPSDVADTYKILKAQPNVTYIIIQDNDEVTVNFKESSYSVIEGEQNLTLTLQVDGLYARPISATIGCRNGSALSGEDFVAVTSVTIDFPVEDEDFVTDPTDSFPISIQILDDDIVEGIENFVCEILSTSLPGRVLIGDNNVVPVDIVDNDKVLVRYAMDFYTVSESERSVALELILEGLTTVDISVGVRTLNLLNVSVGDAATAGDDYGAVGSRVITFPTGVTSQTFVIGIVDDALPENEEYFNADLFLLNNTDNVAIGQPQQPLIEITDDDLFVGLSFESTVLSIFENEAIVTLTVTLNATYPQPIPFTIDVREVFGLPSLMTAVDGVDFNSSLFPREFTIPANQQSIQITIPVIDELLVERDELFEAILSYTANQPGVIVIDNRDRALITIRNDDELRVMFEMSLYQWPENIGEGSIKIIASGQASFDYTVTVTPTDGSAKFGFDYGEDVLVGSGFDPVDPVPESLNFTVMAGQSMFNFTQLIISDGIFEGLESYTLTLSIQETFQDQNILPGSPVVATVEIMDVDDLEVFFDPSQYTVREGENQLIFLRANKEYEIPFSVNVTLTDITTLAGSDYTFDGRDIVVNFTVEDQMGMFFVSALSDLIYEGDETFNAVIVSTSSVRISPGSPDVASIVINDDTSISVFFDPSNYSTTEGGSVEISLAANTTVERTFDIKIVLLNGSAIAPSDYDSSSSPYTVTFSSTDQTPSFVVNTLDDNTVERTEDFLSMLMITADDNNNRIFEGQPNKASVFISDNDELLVFIQPQNYSVTEGNTAVITLVTSTSAYQFDFTVTLQTMDGTADSSDYSSGEYTVTFLAGLGVATLEINTTDDDVLELLEFFKVMIISTSQSDRVQPGSPDLAFVNITDNEPAIEVEFDPVTYSVSENDGVATVTLVTSSTSYDFPFSVTLSYSDITAVIGSDYEGNIITVDFIAGQASASFDVPIINDTVAELPEEFSVTLVSTSEPANVLVGDDDVATVEIIDDDAIEVEFNPVTYSVSENDGVATVTLVTSSFSYDFPFSVTLSYSDITALVGSDYEGNIITVDFIAGQASASFDVPIINDTVAELPEEFSITLVSTNVSDRVVIGDDDVATVEIIDDDTIEVEFDPDTYSVSENDGVATVTLVTSSTSYDFPFSVTLSYSDITAVIGSDYEGNIITVDFIAGQASASFDIPIINDTVAELPEEFSVTLVSTSVSDRVIIGDDDVATVQIIDDEVLTVRFDPALYDVMEGQSAVLVLVTNIPYSFGFTINVDTINVEAIAPDDYTEGGYFVTFDPSPNDTGRSTLEIRTSLDNVLENDETFNATLSVPPQYTGQVVEGIPSMATVTINDATSVLVYFDPEVYVYTEGDVAILTLKTDTEVQKRFSVIVTANDGSAESPSDYEGGMKVVIFEVGSQMSTVNFSTFENDPVEGVEMFTAVISVSDDMRAMGIEPGSPDTAIVDIIDDTNITVMFERSMYSVDEMGPLLNVVILASHAADMDYQLTVLAIDGTAQESFDWTGKQFNITVPAGNVNTSFVIPIINDAIFELTEYFMLQLVVPSASADKNVILGVPNIANVTITDDEPIITVSIESTTYDIIENQPVVEVCLVKSGPSSRDITVSLEIFETTGTGDDVIGATSDVDFVGQSSPDELTIEGNELTKCFEITIRNDEIVEPDEPFSIRVIIPGDQEAIIIGEIEVGNVEGTVTIINDDTITVMWEEEMYMLSESDGEIIVTLLASGEAAFDFNVTVRAMDITAIENSDYTFEDQIVTFTIGTRSRSLTIPVLTDDVDEIDETFKLTVFVDDGFVNITEGDPDVTTVLIKDDDVITVSFSPQNYTTSEGASVPLTIVVDKVPAKDVIVTVTTMDITAEDSLDYMGGSFNVTIPAGETTGTVPVSIIEDGLFELPEDFKATLSIPGDQPDVIVGDPHVAYVTIAEGLVVVTWEQDMYMLTESDRSIVVALNSSEPASFAYDVTVTAMDITAVAPDDYVFNITTVTFPAGETRVTLTISVTEDLIDELDETFKLTVTSSASGVAIGIPDVTTILIKDDDVITVSFSPQNYTTSEGASVPLTIVVDKVPAKDVIVTVTTMDITAEDSLDYMGGSFNVTIPAGETTGTVPVSIIEDGLFELPEDFKATLSIPGDQPDVMVGDPDVAYVTIAEGLVVVTWEQDMYMLTESDGSIVVALNSSEPASFAYNVTVTAMDITAVDPDDYVFSSEVVTFPAGETRVTLTIPVMDDLIDELDETFKLTVTSSASGVAIGSPDVTTILIKDDDVITVSFSPQNYTTSEGASVPLTIVVDKVPAKDVIVTVTTMDITAEDSLDYMGGSFNVTIPAGETTGTVPVSIIEDGLFELPEDFKATLSIPGDQPDVIVGDPHVAYVTIAEGLVVVTWEQDMYMLTESDGSIVVALNSSEPASFAYNVTVTAMDITAVDPDDYVFSSEVVTFPAGETRVTLTIPVMDDLIDELDETFKLTVTSSASGVAIGSPDVTTILIKDDDVITVSFSPQNYTTSEGASVPLTIVVDKVPAKDVTVTVTTMDITAEDSFDYEGGSFNVTIPAGETTGTVPVSIIEDGLFELPEDFKATLSIPGDQPDVIVGDPDVAYVTIAEGLVVVTWEQDMYMLTESDGSIVVALNSSEPASFAYDVTVTAMDITAVAPDDYVFNITTVTFPAGATRVTLTISVTEDLIDELDETFKLTVTSSASGVAIGIPDVTTILIKDDDVITVSFSPQNYTTSEGASVPLTIVVDKVPAKDVTVTVTTMDITAEDSLDYMGGSFNVTIPAGETTGTVPVSIIEDGLFELPEDFKATLSIPGDQPDVMVGDPDVAYVTIAEGLVVVTWEQDMYMLTESDGSIVVALNSSEPASFAYDVTVTAMDITAVDPDDYVFSSEVVTFPAGETRVTLTIPVAEDLIDELDETFKLTVTNSASGVAIGSPDVTTILIKDDDVITVSFSPQNYTTSEGASVPLTIVVDKVPAKDVIVTVTTMDITAEDSLDYMGGSFNVTIPAGETTGTVPVSIIEDGLFELPEDFKATLSIPGDQPDVMVGDPDVAYVTIAEGLVVVTWEQDMYMLTESDGSIVVALNSSEPASFAYDVTVTAMDITAVAPDDYVFNITTVTFPAGATRVTLTISVTEDLIDELDETFKLTVTSSASGVAIGIPDVTTILIKDDDVITVSFSPQNYTTSEGASVPLTIVVDKVPAKDVTVTVTTMDITAEDSLDYMGGSFNVTIPAGETTGTVPVSIIEDGFIELPEDFKATLSIPGDQPDVIVGDPDVAYVTIAEGLVVVTWEQDMYMLMESDGSIVVALNSSEPASFAYDVTVTAMDITAVDPDDYVFSSEVVTFPAGITRVTLTIPVMDDLIDELDETFKLTVTSSASGVAIGSPDVTTILIKDDDVITVSFSPQNYTTSEGASVPLTIVVDKVPAKDITVTVTTMDITAEDSLDYMGGSFNVTIPAGETTGTVPVSIIEDGLFELPEDFKATLSIPGDQPDVMVGDPDVAYVTIAEGLVVVTWEQDMYMLTESDGSIVVALNSSEPASFAYDVTVTAMDITAVDPDDYVFSSEVVTFPAGVTRVTLTIPVMDDLIDELDETFKLTVTSSASGVAIGSPDVTTILIKDDDDEILVRFEPDVYLVKEGVNSFANISLKATPTPGGDFTVTVRSFNGMAILGSDYLGEEFNVTFSAGNNMASFLIPIVDDDIFEMMEDFNLELFIPNSSFVQGVRPGSPDTALVTIMDEANLLVSIELPNYMEKENIDTFEVKITASVPASFDYNVTVTTIQGTAFAGEDFVPRTYEVVFPAGSTMEIITIEIVDDNVIEDILEIFTLQLSTTDEFSNKGIQIGPNFMSEVTVMDNDVQVKFGQTEVRVNEEDFFAAITVIAMGDLSQDFSVIVMAMNGTAIEDLDFTGNMWEILFSSSPSSTSSSSFTIPIISDSIPEETELFGLKIVLADSIVNRTTVGEPSRTTVIIQDPSSDNATVMGDPLFIVPIPSAFVENVKFKPASICYEIHGKSDKYFNLISDQCTSVNAHFTAGINATYLNMMTEIGIVADGTDGDCHKIKIDRKDCMATLDGDIVTTNARIGGISVRNNARRKRFSIRLPNCEPAKGLVLWIDCRVRMGENMLEFVIAYGDGLSSTSHGLLAQFWNIPVTISPYNGTYAGIPVSAEDGIYKVKVEYPLSEPRIFIAEWSHLRWDNKRKPCLYGGDSMGGPIFEAPGYDSVIEGKATDYIVDDLFSTDFRFEQYDGICLDSTPISDSA